MLGGYVAQAEAGPVLQRGRADVGDLLGVPAEGVAFVESAEVATDLALRIWPLKPGDVVAVVPSEWGLNLHAFAERGLRIVEVGTDADGVIDLENLSRLLATAPPAFVHLTQVASHRPLVQPAAAAAAICHAAGVPLWVDAAQALGHVDTACGADVVYATSRKWLTGPRGVGVLGVAEQWWDRLEIHAAELALSSRPADASPVWLLSSGEAHVAGRVGLCNAVREFLDDGPAAVRDRLAAVGGQTREALDGLPGWAVIPGTGSAITALRALNGQDIVATRARLLAEHGIVSTAAVTGRAPREMTEPLLRISPHVDCTPDDLAVLRKALQTLA